MVLFPIRIIKSIAYFINVSLMSYVLTPATLLYFLSDCKNNGLSLKSLLPLSLVQFWDRQFISDI